MSFFYYVRNLVKELRLSDRATRKERGERFTDDLDEAIGEALRGLHRAGKKFAAVKGDPRRNVLHLDASPALVERWKKRAGESLKLLEEYQELPSGKKRDIVRAKLHRRAIRVK